MDEFRMCFKTYAVKHEFDAKTLWTGRKKFYAKCKVFYGSARSCKRYILLDANLMGTELG
jgi:hypothetical protein